MLSVVHNYYYLLTLLIIHSFRTSICVCKYLYMLSITFDDWGLGRGRAYDPDFFVDLSRSRANFRGPEILYIFRRNCYTSLADANSSFHNGWPHASMKCQPETIPTLQVIIANHCRTYVLWYVFPFWKITLLAARSGSPPTVFDLDGWNKHHFLWNWIS